MLQIPDVRSSHFSLLKKFSKNSKIAGIVFILLGLVGIVFPTFMSITSAIFFGWILLFSGFLAAYHTYSTNKTDWMGWLKTFLLILFGSLTVINPFPGVAALGILFALYFMLDAFSSISLAFSLKGNPQWWVVLLNGIVSVVLAALFIVNWPFGSLFYVGLFVGISLFFDGIMLLGMSKMFDSLSKED